MFARRLFILLAGLILVQGAVLAAELPLTSHGSGVINGGPGRLAKAEVDTTLLMGSHESNVVPDYYGDFESFGGWEQSWNGWTSSDLTQTYGASYWHVSDYNRVNGDLSAWCGEIDIPSCAVGDTVGGYGHNYDERLEWRGTVANRTQPCTVTIDAFLNIDTMDGYDYCYLSALTGLSTVTDIWYDDGLISGYHLQETFVYQPADYTGDGSDEVVIQFRVTSDGGWDNEDCLWPGAGAMQLDDVTVTLSNGSVSTFDDFEAGTLGNWTAMDPPGVGDFAQIWSNLEELDPCRSNYSNQVAFIDDGVVVPGTGASECITWCYGPYGYIVNPSGGLAHVREPLHNTIDSPVMDWPDPNYDGAQFEFGVLHQIGLTRDEPWTVYRWSVRSADTDGSGGQGVQDIENQPWVDHGYLYYGYGNYERPSEDIAALLVPGRDQVQVRLAVYEYYYYSGAYDGNPTPYFDNVTLKVFPRSGPVLAVKSAHLAQDGFSASGTLDAADPSVRFDMARNIAGNEYGRNDPGDSIVVSVAGLGVGAVISPAPRLEYRLEPNSDYEAMRTAGLPDAGYVAGTEVLDPVGGMPTGQWAFDLPDTGFLMPGDVLHYLVVATETGPGGTTQTFLPADTTGFHDFSHRLAYDMNFTVRALPGVTDPFDKTVITTGGPALFWFDAEDLLGLDSWVTALDVVANDPNFSTFAYDLYLTRAPASGVGNGLGGRATLAHLENYGTVLYSSGNEVLRTLIPPHNTGDPSDDVGLLTAWLQGDDRKLFLTGDNLVFDLDRSYEGSVFAQDLMGVDHQTDNIRSFIDNQVTPKVVADPGAPLFLNTPSWIAYGGCNEINHFDGVLPVNGGMMAAQFTDPGGNGDAYLFSAATVKETAGTMVVSLPYDLKFVYTDPNAPPMPPYSGRESLVGDVLHAFMYMWGPIGDVPGVVAPLAASSHPNPFNPKATIKYTVPSAGHLTVKVFDVRGSLVRNLLDERVETGGEVVWDGRDTGGAEAASGIYFYEVRHGGQVDIGKMTLVK